MNELLLAPGILKVIAPDKGQACLLTTTILKL
jgi:hypothetical protein